MKRGEEGSNAAAAASIGPIGGGLLMVVAVVEREQNSNRRRSTTPKPLDGDLNYPTGNSTGVFVSSFSHWPFEQ